MKNYSFTWVQDVINEHCSYYRENLVEISINSKKNIKGELWWMYLWSQFVCSPDNSAVLSELKAQNPKAFNAALLSSKFGLEMCAWKNKTKNPKINPQNLRLEK